MKLLTSRRWFWVSILILAGASLGWLCMLFGQAIILMARGAKDTDVLLYFTVARGILNGLTPYVDLFESKPPGMFILSLLSLLTGGDHLMSIMGIATLLSFPALLGWFAWRESTATGRDTVVRTALTVLACLSGVLVALYVHDRSRGVQTELFAAGACAAYGFGLLHWRDRMTTQRLLICSAFLTATLGLREPFIIAAFCIALIASRSPRECVRLFFVPLLIGAVGGVLLLFVLGWLRPYVMIYLPSMQLRVVTLDPHELLWMRLFATRRILADLVTFSPNPSFGVIVLFLWGSLPLLTRQDRRWTSFVAVAVAATLAAFLTFYTEILLVISRYIAMQEALPAGLLQTMLTRAILIILCLIPLLILLYRRDLLWSALTAVLIACLCSFAIGNSNYTVNHFAFAAPVYFMLILLFFRCAAHDELILGILLPATATIILSGFIMKPTTEVWRFLRQDTLPLTASATAPLTNKLDALMDDCHIDRFASTSFQPITFMHHSPWGPFPVIKFFTFFGDDHPLIQATRAHIRSTDLLLVESGATIDPAMNEATIGMTETAPPCAQKYLPLPPFRLFFREPKP